VLTQWLACFPVYRTYAEGGAGQAADQAWRQTAQTRANAHLDPAQQALLAALGTLLSRNEVGPAPAQFALGGGALRRSVA
ncbi:hypothetical protein, partial [Bordetella pertussis]|uniref:hypothetical protein n=1 Tax=Bordetella pertussis TaxID=520 RepID=UPI0012B17742